MLLAGSSLLTLLDDIATLLDDISVMGKLAAKKTAGVLGDDLSLNAQQVSGVRANRELTKGQKVNEISEQLNLSPKTVNSYRYRMFSKLNIHGDVELTHLAIRHGLCNAETLSSQ
ncbi:TPA: DUF808 family protein [Escherichia coli]|nr:DUF808 family protein [Escherichia coli]